MFFNLAPFSGFQERADGKKIEALNPAQNFPGHFSFHLLEEHEETNRKINWSYRSSGDDGDGILWVHKKTQFL